MVKRNMALNIILPAFLFLSLACRSLLACSCVLTSSPCNTGWKLGDTIFLGTVSSKVDVGSTLEIHVTVEESFRGTVQAGSEALVYTGHGGGDCGYPFVAGTSYLVYAGSANGRLGTGICSYTMPEVMAGAVLKELRAIKAGVRTDDLFGFVGIGPNGSGFADRVSIRPLANITVHLQGKRGTQYWTKTEEDGGYVFPSLPLDTYAVAVVPPQGYINPHTVTTEISETKEGCGAEILVRPDGQISGIVVDQTGKGVPGFVTVRPADPKEAQAAVRRGGLPGFDTPDGAFSLQQLPPGGYKLLFYPKIGDHVVFRNSFYWPHTGDGSGNDGIELGLGQHIENVRFEIILRDSLP